MSQVPDLPINLKTPKWNSNVLNISNEEKSTAFITSTLLKDKGQQQRDLLIFLKTDLPWQSIKNGERR